MTYGTAVVIILGVIMYCYTILAMIDSAFSMTFEVAKLIAGLDWRASQSKH